MLGAALYLIPVFISMNLRSLYAIENKQATVLSRKRSEVSERAISVTLTQPFASV